MKTILFIFLFSCSVNKSFAQDQIYKRFKLDLAIGVLIPTGKTFLDQRFSFSVEPKYNLSDLFSMGLRLEIDPYSNFTGTTDSLKVSSVFSYLLTSDYYINNPKNIRPFFGIGIGLFRQTVSSTGYPETKTKSGKPGIETRFGLEWKHLTAALEYNVTFFEEEKKMNYINIKFGTYLWGGRRNK